MIYNPTPGDIPGQHCTCTPVCPAALFTPTKTWRQPQPPSREERERRGTHTQWNILLSQEKNELTPSAATSADLAITILSEVSQRERQIPHSSTHVWNLKHDINGLTHETESDLQTEYTCGSQEKGGVGEGWTGSLGLAHANCYG